MIIIGGIVGSVFGGLWLAEGMSTEPGRPLTTGLTVSGNFLFSGMIRPWMRAELPNVFNTPIVDNPRLPLNSAKCGQVTNLAARQWGVEIGLRLVLWTKPAVAGDTRQRPGRGIALGQCDAGSKTEEMEISDE